MIVEKLQYLGLKKRQYFWTEIIIFPHVPGHGAIQDNVNWNESYGNNINKLIRLPKTTISAIVAVGLRNGLNIGEERGIV